MVVPTRVILATTKGLRGVLKIPTFPVQAPDGAFQVACQNAKSEHIYRPCITISEYAALVPVHKAFAASTTIYYHHAGSPRCWFIIPPHASTKFESLVQQELGSEGTITNCSQFVRNAGIWLKPQLLKTWGVEFFSMK